ncbi:regulatory protein YcgZ [Candidatus Pantoea multigeneris]|uniref:Two-component-system connector protein YcgZ n=1 Tax=Candidatus Pantoea multigeneris TaxID=2608357 RepID=A0ABX0RI63_9GAMM|nr:regulatory protein YcgZ [Pantoea multigeneris]NIF23996.1 two-component-system connector protein YcgZ [Pantoea multigeneris]
MRQSNMKYPDSASEIAHYFSKMSAPNQQEILGQIVIEILRAGKTLNRKAICSKLLHRLEVASSLEEEHHYHTLIGMLFER